VASLQAVGIASSARRAERQSAYRYHLAANVEIAPTDLTRDHPFPDWGGVVAARRLFGPQLDGMLDELSEALAA
jgi:type I restriction enzyme, R subunit